MFNVRQDQKVRTDFPAIVDNYRILHFDDEPILYSGTNKFGNKLLGSLLDEDAVAFKKRYLHVVIESKDYFKFVTQAVTYKQVLQNYKEIYLIDKNEAGEIEAVYFASVDDIPNHFLPLNDSYCPKQNISFGYQFILGLKGKLADMNAAIPNEIGAIQSSFAKFIEGSFEKIGANLRPSVFQTAYSAGSFRLNFGIDFAQDNPDQVAMFPESNLASSYLKAYIEYCTKHLSEDAGKIWLEHETPLHYQELVENVKGILQENFVSVPHNLSDILIEKLKVSAVELNNLSENIGDNFTSIEVINKLESAEEIIAIVDEGFKESISRVSDIAQAPAEVEIVDVEPMDYQICIYHLNKKSRNGNAYIFNIDSDSEMSNPKIRISGDQILEETKYTESLYLNKWIDVKAVATKVGNRFKNLQITF